MSAPTNTHDLRQLKVGDRVQVFDVNGRRMGRPSGGWDGTVVKVGRKLIHVDHPGLYGRGPKAFRLDDGRINDNYGHQYIKTPEQAAEETRRAELRDRLRSGGLDLRLGGPTLTTQTLEALAAVLDQAEVSS